MILSDPIAAGRAFRAILIVALVCTSARPQEAKRPPAPDALTLQAAARPVAAPASEKLPQESTLARFWDLPVLPVACPARMAK